ncbi:hypothetical protein ACTGJ9_024865 [Bradyrhizobium sp. RDM12]
MAQPIIVAGATTHGLAQMGPGIDHGPRPYSRKALLVKRELPNAVRREAIGDAGIDRVNACHLIAAEKPTSLWRVCDLGT